MSQNPPPPDPKSPAGAAGKAQGPKKNTRRNLQREDARSSFNPSAPKMSIEQFFTGFLSTENQNVEYEMDLNVQERIAEPYLAKARDYAERHLSQDSNQRNLQSLTYAMISIGMVRKLMKSLPNSEESELSRFQHLSKADIFLPKSSIVAIDALGKTTEGNLTVRLAYHSQDMFRLLLKMCKVMNYHDDFHGSYVPPIADVEWADLDVTRIVTVSKASAKWMRAMAPAFLEQAYRNHWTVIMEIPVDPIPNPNPNLPPEQQPPRRVEMEMSYPHLPIMDNEQDQLREFLAWIVRLNPEMPNVRLVLAAGFATIWKKRYFERVEHLIHNVERDLPPWFPNLGIRPLDLLNLLNVFLVPVAEDVELNTSYIAMIKDIHQAVLDNQYAFNGFLDLARQPDSDTGTLAQILEFRANDFRNREVVGFPELNYYRMIDGATAKSYFSIPNNGAASLGLAFGYSMSVRMIKSRTSRLQGDPDSIRRQFIRTDFIRT